MYEPWGYRDENNYQGAEIIHENDLDNFFAGAEYKRDDNKIHFTNKDGEDVGSLDVNEFVKSDSIIDHTDYKDGILSIYFTNGDVVTINLTELLDENEFKDGFIVNDHVVKVLIDGESDDYLSVGENGVKVAGVKADIDAEEARATSVETALDEKIDSEIARATSAETALDTKIDDEVARAEAAEQALDEKVSAEKGRAEIAEANLSRRADTLNDELDAEKTIRESEDAKLDKKIDTEIDNRKVDVDEEETRAKAAEQALQGAIDDEKTRAEEKEMTLQDSIDAEEARAISAETDLQNSIELKADKETVYTQEQVDAMLAEKQTEIDKIISDYEKLKEIVGDLGGDVEYSVPADGKLTDMLKKSGIIKLTEDVESNTYAGGITSKNIATLNLGGKTITTTANTTTNPSIMVRGTQQFTIQGSGTLNANGHIAIEANGENAVITLGGTAFGRPTYVTNREGELIYCYLGTINITNGVFRNDNDNKAFLLNCYDANYKNGTAKIVVTGGKFYDFNPANNTSEGEGTSYVPEGYVSVESTETIDGVEHKAYTVKKNS